jgi:hypothetical protein
MLRFCDFVNEDYCVYMVYNKVVDLTTFQKL